MDSITQIALGAAVATACVPAEHKRKAAVIGAVLGTLPDLDVLIDYGDAVSNFTYHRGFSHSLFVLFPFSIVLWALLRKFYQPVKSAPGSWLFAISLALLTHPLLDAHTAYGTQLFWPLGSPPIMWSTIFIIDPLYTLPLIIGVIAIAFRPNRAWASRTLLLGIVFSSGYLVWTWVAKYHVHQQVAKTLPAGEEYGQVFSTPILFTTVLWRVVVLQEHHYLEGYYSFVNPAEPIEFNRYPRVATPYGGVQSFSDAQRLYWFSQGFVKAAIVDDELVISDLRMGYEGNYVFNHAIAEVEGAQFRAMQSQLLRVNFSSESIGVLWGRLVE